MQNELVRYSRAGDIFHYRWAARRCLRLISPKSPIQYIVIEGSKEKELAGEYVIDVAEYSVPLMGGFQEIDYYQLKHTTVKKYVPFNLSDLKETFEGFSKRYLDCINNNHKAPSNSQINFTIVTNRPISENLKNNVVKIVNMEKVNSQFRRTLEKYTQLSGDNLRGFCACLKFADGEGDYNAQKYELHAEISQILAGSVDSPEIENITALVRDKALPHSNGLIVREEILKYFGVTSEHDLFPAPPEFEKLENVLKRIQHESLLKSIINSKNPLIIHAPGGVGKTVFARQIVQSLPIGSFGIVYDCFGGGRYRNRSELRHRYRDALVQIANEMASQGFCDPLLIKSSSSEDDILRKFLDRLKTSVSSLRTTNADANLVILIDAADNAEMAAIEFNDNCFVHELLREDIIDGVKIIALCRTERVHLLQPLSSVKQIELKPFSEEESFNLLISKYPEASIDDGLEFNRLTNGNPRVQANALSLNKNTINQLFIRLSGIGTTVDEQIKGQLNSAVSKIKDRLAFDYKKQVDSICIGLATLPPFIPLRVLSKAADVEESTIKSFVADMGRPLWVSDTSVQFRDEPTETWFRETFAASKEQIQFYIERLKPLAREYTYVASTLPSLLLQAEMFSELVDLALSDDLLPDINPIDERNVRVYRLQFAFKASLKQRSYANAIKLALRAGEEVAGDKRQLELLRNNIDLIAPLLDEERVQVFAFRRQFTGEWIGSENVYSASLLSNVKQFKGEARNYLRAALNWLDIYFKERDKRKKLVDQPFHHEQLKHDDIVELVHAHLNLYGVKKAVDYLLRWRPGKVIYRVSRELFKRLVDAGDFATVAEIAQFGLRSQYLIIALTHELLEVGHLPSAEILRTCLDLLTIKRTRIDRPQDTFQDTTLLSLISFLESCAARGLPKEKILRVLKYYYSERAPRSITSNFQHNDRDVYFRALVLKNVLLNKKEYIMDALLPEDILKEKNYKNDQETKEFMEIIDGLTPWYLVRLRSLMGTITNFFNEVKDAENRSKTARANRWRDYDRLPMEISKINSEILNFHRFVENADAKNFYENYVHKDNKLLIQDRLKLVRSAFRLDHLIEIKRELEQDAFNVIRSATDEGPEIRANLYIDLARAVVNLNRDDAAIYFNFAIDAVSKFGDEIVERWEAVVSLANRREKNEYAPYEIAYRFIRCAELIGENVDREKYWDRVEAIRTCVRLSPVSAIAALSRWRDREIGSFNRQLVALAEEILSTGYLSPTVAWSVSAFMDASEVADFSLKCIEKEQLNDRRKYILDAVIKELRINGIDGPIWRLISEKALKFSLQNEQLEEVIAHNNYESKQGLSKQSQETNTFFNLESEETVNWGQILGGLRLYSNDGLRKALEHYDAIPGMSRNKVKFWQEVYNQIHDSYAVKFLYSLLSTDNADMYDVQDALLQLPGNWYNKISVKNEWPKIMETVGRRFAKNLVERDMVSFFTRGFRDKAEIIPHIQKGIIQGLSSLGGLGNAEEFFGFVSIASKLITTHEATELLDFALLRFEMHIEDDFSDGPWSNLLLPPSNIDNAFAGFVWSALGSPRRSTRWRAAHCVRRLADAKCVDEIEELINWMERDVVGPFCYQKFPFYNLHARLYLLIAFARISIDNPQILLRYSKVFYKYALKSIPHILIRKYASKIALNLENALPGTYTKGEIQLLNKVGISQYSMVKVENRWEKKDSYWHENGKVNTNLKFHHGYDFDSYWFEPLGQVFGISAEQIEDLATDVVLNEWNIDNDGGYQNDPRHVLWRSSSKQQETYHSHGEYPRVEDYNFYLSFHAMFVVAAKLLDKMPVVKSRDWYEDEWKEWFSRFLITRSDGLWLYDCRDAVPLTRRKWIFETKTSNWLLEINSNDFLDAILADQGGETWLNLFGSWVDSDGDRSESFYITSSLVSLDTSQALLNALSTCADPHDFKLPDYKEDDMEFNEFPFILKGWVSQEEVYKCLDRFDPHSAKLDYPPYKVGELFVEQMMLSFDDEKRVWVLPREEKTRITCELWSTINNSGDGDPSRYGNRLTASLSFLKELCLAFNCEIIIEVQIKRRYLQNSYFRSEETDGYKPPLNKIFVLSADGRLRDTETYYELG